MADIAELYLGSRDVSCICFIIPRLQCSKVVAGNSRVNHGSLIVCRGQDSDLSKVAFMLKNIQV